VPRAKARPGAIALRHPRTKRARARVARTTPSSRSCCAPENWSTFGFAKRRQAAAIFLFRRRVKHHSFHARGRVAKTAGLGRMSVPLRRLRYASSTRAWSLRYIFEKATQQTIPFGLREAFGEDGKKEGDIPAMELMRRINEHVLDQPMCSQMLFRGEAMAPELSCAPRFAKATSDETKNQTNLTMLILRPLRHAGTMPGTYARVGGRWFFPRPARVGDVVAFIHPDTVAKSEHEQVVLIRRVAALAGDLLESVLPENENTETKTFQLPKNKAWVVADNPATDAPDSRNFGPIAIDTIVGRVVYHVRSSIDHGTVGNNPLSVDEDAAVVAAEVDANVIAHDLKESC
jgi:hypothetical protein